MRDYLTPKGRPFILRVSRPGEFHPEALAEPDRTLSRHPAPIKEPLRIVPSVRTTLAAGALAP